MIGMSNCGKNQIYILVRIAYDTPKKIQKSSKYPISDKFYMIIHGKLILM